MCAAEQPFAPACDEIAVAVEHDHRVDAAIEDVDAVLAVDRDRGDIAEVPTLRQLRPVLHHAVAMLARAENGRHVVFSPWLFVWPSFRDGPKDQARNLEIPGSRFARPGMTSGVIHASAASGSAACATRGSNPSSTALICNARYFELMRHWARPPAMNHRPGWRVRVYMLRNSWLSPNPQIGPMRSTTFSPNNFRTSSSWRLYPVASTIRSAASVSPLFIRAPSATKPSISENCFRAISPLTIRSEQPTLK